MRMALGWQRGWWLLSVHAPRVLARICGVPKHFRVTQEEQALVDSVIEHFFPITAKARGAVFDSLVSEPASNTFPLEQITVPTLLVHAPDDPLAGYQWVEQAAARIPHSNLATIPRGGHLFLGSTKELHEATQSFVAASATPETRGHGVPASYPSPN